MAEQVLSIKGPITMATAGKIYRDIATLSAQSPLCIDFSGMEQVDSSAIALLISILRRARKAPDRIKLGVIPNVIAQFSEIYGLDDQFRENLEAVS